MSADKKYRIEDARAFTRRFTRRKIYKGVDSSEIGQALKAYATIGDEINFRKVVDKYKLLTRTLPEGDNIRREPLSFLEFICAGLDSSFTYIGYSAMAGRRVEEGPTQSMLIKLYGRHWNVEPRN